MVDSRFRRRRQPSPSTTCEVADLRSGSSVAFASGRSRVAERWGAGRPSPPRRVAALSPERCLAAKRLEQ